VITINIIKLEPKDCNVKWFYLNCINDLNFIVDTYELFYKLRNFFCKKCFYKQLDQCKLFEKPKNKRCSKENEPRND
jgi:hypothetical protein